MKKLLIGLGLLLGLLSAHAHAAPLYGYVQITTTTALTPTLQNGAINVSSGTVRTLTVSTFTFTTSFAGNSKRLTSIGNPTSSSDAATKQYVDSLANGSTNYIQSTSVLQSGATFYVSSGTVNSQLNLNGPLSLTGSQGSAGQSLQSNASSAPTWVNVPSAILSTTSTWTAAQTLSSATITALTSTSIIVATMTPTNIVGTTTNNNAPAGDFGEFVSSITTTSISLTNNTYADIASITLTGCDWDVYGQVGWTNNGSTMTACKGGIGTASGNSSAGLTDGDTSLWTLPPTTGGSGTDSSVSVRARKSISGSTSYFLKALVLSSAGNAKAYGKIEARRVR